MSFPQRQPMGMPGMPPGMMSRGYGFAPMGMIPMGMGIMPMMRPQMGMAMTPQNTNSAPKLNKKLVPQEIPKIEKKDEKPPVTTVFVGNISDRAPDSMIRQMLQRCGNVLSWKRVQGASGKLQAFGFCEYEQPEATLRCIRLLNEWQIADKKLVVKVDAKTKTLLDEYKKKAKEKAEPGPEKKKEKKKGSDSDDDEDSNGEEEEDGEDESSMREDRVAKAGLDAIMREYSRELSKEPSTPTPGKREEERENRRRKKEEKEQVLKDAGLDDMELEEEQKDLINHEIRRFRNAHKSEEKETDRERDRDRDRDYDMRRRREQDHDREWEARREREREREREKERERERATRERERERIKERSRSKSHERERSRSRERERERERTMEDEEEVYERRKLERKMRDKEAAYQEMLKKWETRERKKMRDYEKERDREDERKAEEAREARRLKEFLEDYDDERDDPKYYKGSALQRRLKEREKEMEADERDRQREREEMEEIRRRLMEEGHPDPEAEMARIEREREEHLMHRLKLPSEEPEEPAVIVPPAPPVAVTTPQTPVENNTPVPTRTDPVAAVVENNIPTNNVHTPQPSMEPSVSSHSSPESDYSAGMGHGSLTGGGEEESSRGVSPMTEETSSQPFIGPATQEDHQHTRIGFTGLKLGASDSPGDPAAKRKKLSVGDVFNQDDDATAANKKRKLVPLDYAGTHVHTNEPLKAAVAAAAAVAAVKKPTTAEEKRKCIKNLIEKIPTGKNQLFAYGLDWTMVDGTLMDRRIKPWVNKKIVEYIGEEEPTLTDFICQKVMANSEPQSILNDVAMVLDEEAEVFVVKMWRLLIYETEAKKLGLVK